MKIKGKYDIGGLNTIPCEVEIAKGMLEVFGDGVRQPRETRVFEVKRTIEESGLIQTTNYFIRYVKNDNEEQIIYTQLSKLQLFEIKRQRKELALQKITSVEYAIGLIIAFLINIAASCAHDWITHRNTVPKIINSINNIIEPMTVPNDSGENNQFKKPPSTFDQNDSSLFQKSDTTINL